MSVHQSYWWIHFFFAIDEKQSVLSKVKYIYSPNLVSMDYCRLRTLLFQAIFKQRFICLLEYILKTGEVYTIFVVFWIHFLSSRRKDFMGKTSPCWARFLYGKLNGTLSARYWIFFLKNHFRMNVCLFGLFACCNSS